MKTVLKQFKNILSLILLFCLALTSCDSDDDNSSSITPANQDIVLDLGSSIQRDFMGTVVDVSNMPIENVSISIGSEMATTDANGIFIIYNATVKEKQAYIIAEKAGYLNGMRTLIPTLDMNTTRIMLISENVIATVASGSESEVDLPNGTKVKFDGSFKDASGNLYNGNVDVMMYHLDPSNPDIEDIMPGNMQAANQNGEERVLETYGMLNVELRSSSGEKLNIADGHTAEIEIPIDPAQSSVAPSSIPLWHFDEEKGYWIEDGQADKVGGKYVGEVTHFSWWNCDAQFPTVTLCLTVIDPSGNHLSNVKVELWRTGAIYPRQGTSNSNGQICGLVPYNETLTLKAYDPCGVLVHTATIGPFTTNTTLNNLVLNGVTTTTITGNFQDCSGNAVTNGYVVIDYGNYFSTVNVTNGSFTFTVIACITVTTFNLEGVNYTTFETTGNLPYTISSPNVGNITACTTITEYVSTQIDSNPVEYYLLDIEANENTSSSGFTVTSENTSGNFFYLYLSDNTLGTYSFTNSAPGFSLELTNANINYNIPNNLQFTLTGYGGVGQYIDGTISGTYTDTSGVVRTLLVNVHVFRDL